MMTTVRTQLQGIAERINALSLRERALIFVGMMTALYVLAMSIVFAPLRAEHVRLESALHTKHQEIQMLNTQLQSLTGTPDQVEASQRARVNVLRNELHALDQRLEQITGGMVSPQQMAKLLEQALGRTRGLEIVKLENLPKTLAMEENSSANTAALYKHGVRIEVRGSYFELVEYLRMLEALPWKVYWGEVSLEAQEHSVSKLTLVIYTLSRRSGWIGA